MVQIQKPGKVARPKSYTRRSGFRLFLLTSPFLALIFVFSYLPLLGWSISFFDYKAGFKLFDTPFVGFKYFLIPFSNEVLREDLLRVLGNTIVMSLLNLLVATVIPMMFAVLLQEVSARPYRKLVQVMTTIPHFISWVLVYSLVWAFFSLNDGFVNHVLTGMGVIKDPIPFLGTNKNVWLTQWAYNIWKNLGWSSIMFISAITSIDAEMYEAAKIDGAGRYAQMFHITIPCLMPTFFVLLVLNIGNLLNNGMEQYYIFQTAMNKQQIEVLDLYVFNQGIRGNHISYSTAVGMLKSLISLLLLYSANRLSKTIRGESVF